MPVAETANLVICEKGTDPPPPPLLPPPPDGDPKPKVPGFELEVIGDKAAYKSGTPCPHSSLYPCFIEAPWVVKVVTPLGVNHKLFADAKSLSVNCSGL